MTDLSAAPSGTRSTKLLQSTAAANAYQKAFVKSLYERVVVKGEPFAILQADVPHEIFHAMDIPVVTNQWWSAYIAAKQLAPRYSQVLSNAGFPASGCRYCSLGLGCTLDKDPSVAPWGGLPRPTVLVARLTCDCVQRVFSLWAEALGSRFYALDAPGWEHKDPAWFRNNRHDWEQVYSARRIDLLTEESRGLIRMLEEETGRRFDPAKLKLVMGRINTQEELLEEASLLATRTRPCPVAVADQMPNVMIPQWHRGSEWALEHAARFRDEVKARVDAGLAAAGATERYRLMWIGAGLWHDPGFYSALEERMGAAFVWSMYLPFAGANYIRYGGEPLRALSSRICSMNEVLHLPPWMNSWMVEEAKACGIDAAIMLTPPTNRISVSGTHLTRRALEAAGVPVMEIDADMVDAGDWSHDRMVQAVSDFLATRIGKK